MSYRTQSPAPQPTPSLHFPLKGKQPNRGVSPALPDLCMAVCKSAQEYGALQDTTLIPRAAAPKRL